MERVELDEERLNSQIFDVLKAQNLGTAEEIAFRIAEMSGIATEEGNAEMILAVKEKVERLADEGKLEVVRSKHASKRYKLIENQA